MKKKIISCILVLAVAVAFMPTMAFAASHVKMKVYDEVYKTGNTIYAAGAQGIYKVTVKKGVKKKSKLIYHFSDDVTYFDDGHVFAMKKKGKYIYFLESSTGTAMILHRIKTNGKSHKRYCQVDNYVIKGKKIYFEDFIVDKKYVMKLNGKSKKKTKTKISMMPRISNKSGYELYYKVNKGYVEDWLKTPKGLYYLGKIRYEEQDEEEYEE